MWYVVQTPVGREAEAAEKLNHFYRDKAEKPCFVLSKERTWRMGGVYYVDTEVMFPGYVFVDTADEPVLEDGVKCLAGLVRFLNAGSEAHPYGTAVPLKKEEEKFLKELLREDSSHTVRRFLVRANDAGEIEWAEGVLGEMLPKIIRKRLRKRIVTIQAELLNEARQVELAIRMEDDPEAVFPKKGPLNPKNLSGDFQENDFSRVSVFGKNPSKKITRLHGAENDGTKLAAE